MSNTAQLQRRLGTLSKRITPPEQQPLIITCWGNETPASIKPGDIIIHTEWSTPRLDRDYEGREGDI